MKRSACLLAAWLWCAAAGVGCEDEPTEVVVILDLADDVDERDGLELELTVESVHPAEDAVPRGRKAARWPYKIALHPKGGDAARRYSLTATAFHGDERVAAARLVSGFVEGERRYVRVLLAARCDLEACAAEQTCPPARASTSESCVDGEVNPARFSRSEASAPDLDDLLEPLADAGAPGAGSGGSRGDAGRGESGTGGSPATLPDGGSAGSGPLPDGGGEPPCTPGTADCVPRLASLRAEIVAGEDALAPAFDAEIERYAIALPLAAASVRIVPSAPAPVTIRVGDREVASGSATEVPVPAGDSELAISVADPQGAGTTYRIQFSRGAQQAYLKANDTAANALFGSAVASAGDTLVVGAPNHGSGRGSVYVFTRAAGGWVRAASFYGATAGDRFGASVAIAGDLIAVGAPGEDMSSGAVHLIMRAGGEWSTGATVQPEEGESADQFGCSVALAAGTLVAGALFESGSATGVNGTVDDDAVQSGAAYVFERDNGGTFNQVAYLKADNTAARHKFGAVVAIAESADAIAVAATGDESVEGRKGAVHVFEKVGTDWEWRRVLRAEAAVEDQVFGFSVALSDGTLAVGARGDTADNAGRGAAYIYERSAGGSWERAGEILEPRLVQDGDGFGSSVAISGDLLLIGAAHESGSLPGIHAEAEEGDDREPDSGAVYAYLRIDGAWIEQAYLKAHNPGANDRFGLSVAVWQNTIVVGSSLEDSGQAGPSQGSPSHVDDDTAMNSGAAYVFR